MRFVNPSDLSLVWSERPWHVQGDLFVIQSWCPGFDPYLEEIQWVDLWIRIPRFPTELLNFESVANLLAGNNVGTLIKLDPRSLLRHKIRFARACIRVDIREPLLEFAEIKRAGGKVCGYNIWYEDFSSGCSFCGNEDHDINLCPLLNAPPKDVKIYLLKSPKQKTLAELLSQASRQAQACTMAQQAPAVQAKPKPIVRNSAASFSKPKMASKSGVLGNKSHVVNKASVLVFLLGSL